VTLSPKRANGPLRLPRRSDKFLIYITLRDRLDGGSIAGGGGRANRAPFFLRAIALLTTRARGVRR
jgi:hypothetical protein